MQIPFIVAAQIFFSVSIIKCCTTSLESEPEDELLIQFEKTEVLMSNLYKPPPSVPIQILPSSSASKHKTYLLVSHVVLNGSWVMCLNLNL